MADVITYDHTFGSLPGPVPLSDLDDNFGNVSDALASLNTFSNYLLDTGAADAYVVTLGAGTTASLANGLMIQMKAVNTNTAASTLNFNGTGAKAIKNMDGSALTAAQIAANAIMSLIYSASATAWLLLTPCTLIDSYTATLTGCTTAPTTTVRYTKSYNVVTLNVPGWNAVSNATTKTYTGMPAAIRPARQQGYQLIGCIDNGGGKVPGRIDITAAGVIDFYPSLATNSWTNSGSAIADDFELSYTLA